MISVIVPCYNVEKYVIECLESIRQQSFQNFEVICVDDCSTDHTLELLKKYQKNYPHKLKIIEHDENKGPGITRNTGIKASKGEYLSFIDGDDTISSNFLEALYQSITQYDADFASTEINDKAFNTQKKYTYSLPEGLVKATQNDVIYKIDGNSTCRRLYRTSFFLEHIQSFPHSYCAEDAFITVKCWITASRVSYTYKTSYIYRKNMQSLTQSIIESDRIQYVTNIYRKIYCFCKEYAPDKYKELFVYIALFIFYDKKSLRAFLNENKSIKLRYFFKHLNNPKTKKIVIYLAYSYHEHQGLQRAYLAFKKLLFKILFYSFLSPSLNFYHLVTKVKKSDM